MGSGASVYVEPFLDSETASLSDESTADESIDTALLEDDLSIADDLSDVNSFYLTFLGIAQVQQHQSEVDGHANQACDDQGHVHDKITMQYPQQIGREQKDQGIKRKIVYLLCGKGLVELREELHAVDDGCQGGHNGWKGR